MTETHGDGQSTNFAEQTVTPSSTPQAIVEERTFKQSEVNSLVGRAKQEAVERFKRENSVASHQPQANTYYQPNYVSPQPPQQNSQFNGMSENEYRRIAAEEAQRKVEERISESSKRIEEQNAQRIVSEFYTKVGAGEGGVQGFEKKCADVGIDLRSIPYIVQLANMVDNTKDVMHEFINNPVKIGQIQNLIDIDLRSGRQPTLAYAEIKRLSSSLNTNAQAANFNSPNEPLSQMRPSNAGTGNKGPLTVSDYRKKYKV